MGKTNWFFDGNNKLKNKQKGLYVLFVEKKGIPVETLEEIMAKYRDLVISQCTSNRSKKPYQGPRWKHNILLHACDEVFFPKFLDLVTQETGIPFKKRRRRKREDYDDFAEQQLDYMMHGGSIKDF